MENSKIAPVLLVFQTTYLTPSNPASISPKKYIYNVYGLSASPTQKKTPGNDAYARNEDASAFAQMHILSRTKKSDLHVYEILTPQLLENGYITAIVKWECQSNAKRAI